MHKTQIDIIKEMKTEERKECLKHILSKWIKVTKNQNTQKDIYIQGCNSWLKNKRNINVESADLFVDFLPYRLLGGYSKIKTFLSEDQFQRRIEEIKCFIEVRAESGKFTYCLNSILNDLKKYGLNNDSCKFVKSINF